MPDRGDKVFDDALMRVALSLGDGKIIIRKIGDGKWAVMVPFNEEPIIVDSFEIARDGVATFVNILTTFDNPLKRL